MTIGGEGKKEEAVTPGTQDGSGITARFSQAEYRRILILAGLGEWMINAIRKEPDLDYEAAASKVFAFVRGTPLESLVRFNSELGDWTLSESLEDELHALIDQYDDTTFWEELTARLTERDLIEARGERAVQGMRPEERARAISSIAQDYTREFEDQGLARLRVTD